MSCHCCTFVRHASLRFDACVTHTPSSCVPILQWLPAPSPSGPASSRHPLLLTSAGPPACSHTSCKTRAPGFGFRVQLHARGPPRCVVDVYFLSAVPYECAAIGLFSPVGGRHGCFRFGAIMKSESSPNICTRAVLWTSTFFSLGCVCLGWNGYVWSM